jgi:hypothetical protein
MSYIRNKVSSHPSYFTVEFVDDVDQDDQIASLQQNGFDVEITRDETGCPCCWRDIIAVRTRPDAIIDNVIRD